MRIPEKPPTGDEIHKLGSEQADFKKNVNELRPFLDIVNEKYLHWDELQARFKGIDLKLLWLYVKLTREVNARAIRIDRLALRYVQTPQIEKALHDLDMRVGGRFDFDAQVTSVGLKRKYRVNSLMEEAIASSQLEGAATTRAAAKEMLRENRKPRTRDEQMIMNNYVTMTFIKENTQPKQPLALELIKEIHRKVTKDTLEKKEYEGTFRTDNEVKVYSRDIKGQVIHEPPDHNSINGLMEQVCIFANSEPVGFYLHPIVKAIMLHYMIGYIHPFNDGNGRTARALFYWYLLSQGYAHLEYVAVSAAIKKAPGEYALAYLYSETDGNDVTYFVKFNLRQIDIALTLFERYIKKKISENKRVLGTIEQDPQLNFRQADLLVTMSKDERPMTVKEMRKSYDITYETARTDLLGLCASGYLHKRKIGKQFIFLLDKEKAYAAK